MYVLVQISPLKMHWISEILDFQTQFSHIYIFIASQHNALKTGTNKSTTIHTY